MELDPPIPLEFLFKRNISFYGMGIISSLSLGLLQACSIHCSIHPFFIRLCHCKDLLKVEHFELGVGDLPALFIHYLIL